MKRDEILTLISSQKWDELLVVLKDNKLFGELMKDEIFTSLFNQYFIDEFINNSQSQKKEDIIELTAIRNFHRSQAYNFTLDDANYRKLNILLVEKTGDYNIALEVPDHPLAKEIIVATEASRDKTIKKTQQEYLVNKNFQFKTFEKENITSHGIPVVKSPQERECFLAAVEVFYNSFVLPNVALSTVINNNVLKTLEGKEKWFFLSTTVDIVIVDKEKLLPTYFFELDSKYHEEELQIKKDKLKNRLITKAGFELHRISKKFQDAGIDEYKVFLNKVKADDD